MTASPTYQDIWHKHCCTVASFLKIQAALSLSWGWTKINQLDGNKPFMQCPWLPKMSTSPPNDISMDNRKCLIKTKFFLVYVWQEFPWLYHALLVCCLWAHFMINSIKKQVFNGTWGNLIRLILVNLKLQQKFPRWENKVR